VGGGKKLNAWVLSPRNVNTPRGNGTKKEKGLTFATREGGIWLSVYNAKRSEQRRGSKGTWEKELKHWGQGGCRNER